MEILTGDVTTQLSAAMVAVWIIEFIKAKFTGNVFTEKVRKFLHRLFGIIFAALAAIGIGYVWNPEAGEFTITGLTATGMLTAFLLWLKAFVLQQGWWRAFKFLKSNNS